MELEFKSFWGEHGAASLYSSISERALSNLFWGGLSYGRRANWFFLWSCCEEKKLLGRETMDCSSYMNSTAGNLIDNIAAAAAWQNGLRTLLGQGSWTIRWSTMASFFTSPFFTVIPRNQCPEGYTPYFCLILVFANLSKDSIIRSIHNLWMLVSSIDFSFFSFHTWRH